MTFPLYETIFYLYAVLLLVAATMVIVSRHPVHAILYLVLAFFASAVLWMLMQAEFLSLVLIFVYVGAVMTLFLFVVMMLHVDLASLKEGFVRFVPVGMLVLLALVATMFMVVSSPRLALNTQQPLFRPADYSNTVAVGDLLFTHYLYAFEIAAFILLVAMVAAITLAFRGRKAGTKSQTISEQLKANKRDNLRLVDIKSNPAES